MIDFAMTIKEALEKKILVLDGAMGTMVQRYGLCEEDFRGSLLATHSCMLKGNNDILVLTRPDVIRDIHRRYLVAGADIIETSTFNANRISQAEYGCGHLCAEINRQAATMARELADAFSTPEKPRFVVGSVGPTSRTCSISPDVENAALRNITFDTLAEAYKEQMVALIEGGVDALLCETIFDTLNAKAALYAADEACAVTGRNVPVMLSFTIADKQGRILSGQTIEAFIASVSGRNLLSVGLNCSFGAREMKPFLRRLSEIAPCYVSVYPNAGLPNELGEYDQTPEEMAAIVREYVDEKLVNIVGGCCGTTDEFIALFPSIVDGVPPRRPVAKPAELWLSGLDALVVDSNRMNFINVGERCNVAGSRKFLRLINEKKYAEALDIARKQAEDGAQLLDINMDDGLLDAKTEMTTFLNMLAGEPDIARLPIMVDSSDWNVISAGLKCIQGRAVVNSLSLKEGEALFVERAIEARRLGAVVIVMAFDENGQATTYERKIEVCGRAFELLTKKAGYEPYEVIFDPNILAVATGIEEHSAYGIDFIRACAWIKENLCGAHISGGVSNLSFSFRGNNYVREALHAVFLYHAIAAGMDMGIVNPQTTVQYDDIPLPLRDVMENVVLNRTPDATERLIVLAGQLKGKDVAVQQAAAEAWRDLSVEQRLEWALLKGVGEYLATDLDEAVAKYGSAVGVISGPLMGGMERVGELFGEGKLFLPQVVKAARTMKQAVTILQPLIGQSQCETSQSSGRVLVATVKGDVHDIGKNIATVVMGCNGYEVIDLGVMVEHEKIVAAALEKKVDIVALSGLITPSLDEMITVVRELKTAGLTVPVMIAGATTSPLHTALKIAPEYDGAVVHVKDVSQNVVVAAELLGDASRKEAYIAGLKEMQASLRRTAGQRAAAPLRSLEEARANKPNLF